jgi:glycosyltransferase involved in cell wall biosynthesis
MRIAFAIETPASPDRPAAARIHATLRELRILGHEVLTIAPLPSGAAPAAVLEPVVAAPPVRFPLDRSLTLGVPHPRVVRALARFRPHVVHALSPVDLGLFALAAARALAIPSLASFHAALPARAAQIGVPRVEAATWRLLRTAHALADLSLAASQPMRDALVARGFPAFGFWRAGVDCELFHPQKRSQAVRESLLGPELAGAPVLLCASRLAAEPNFFALAPLLRELPGARLVIAGEGPALPRLKRAFARLPVGFASELGDDERAELFASADVFFVPPFAEVPCAVALEAMASGLPIVAADTSAIREVVKHEEMGFLYDAAEPKSALEPIRRLLASRALAESLGRAARAEAEQRTWRRTTATLVGCYELAIERAERRSLRVKLRNFLDG